MIPAGKLVVILALCISCFSISKSTICPYREDLYIGAIGCNCIRSTVDCQGLSAMPVLRIGVNITAVDTITIREGRLKAMNKKDIPTGIIKIEISKNPLNFISEDAFNNSATTLQEVIISEANFSQLPAALFKLPNLISLTIADMRYRDWDVSPLENTSTAFRSLSLVNVQLSAWPGWFSSFRLVTKIDFSGNPFKSIPNDAFSSVKDTIEDVSLANTELTVVPTALRILRNLAFLRLSNNNIVNVNGRPGIEELNLFPCATTLTSLEIDSMSLNVIPNFSNLTNLITLKLANNSILDTVDVHVSQSLTTLDLSSNKLSSVPAFVSNIYSLTNLKLSFNRIREITDFSFRNLSLLQKLYLDNNRIMTISNSAFSSLKTLKVLNIRDNLLSRMPLALTSLSNIERLFIQVQLCCPTEPELITWYSLSRNLLVTGTCGSVYIQIDRVLRDYCQGLLSTTVSALTTRSGSTLYGRTTIRSSSSSARTTRSGRTL